MQTVIMAIAIIKDGDRILLRKTDPAKNPYKEPWALFGGHIEGDGDVVSLLSKEMQERWNFSVSIDERLWWDEDTKVDHDGKEKRFVYLDALCSVASGGPKPVNTNEELKWVKLSELTEYQLNPPTRVVLKRLKYIS